MRKIIFFIVFFVSSIAHSQYVSFKKEQYVWPNVAPSQSKQTDDFMNEDVVIIDEVVKFNLLTRSIQVMEKNCILKVNTENGVKKLKSISLPESFDVGADYHLAQQGRQKLTQAPFIYDFKIIHFAARVLKKNGTIVDLPMNVKINKVFWLENDGNRLENFNYIFSLENIEVGDVLEYNYLVHFVGRYGFNLFFLMGTFPNKILFLKLNILLSEILKISKSFLVRMEQILF